MDFWKLPTPMRAVIAGILTLLLAFSGISTQAIAEALTEMATESTVLGEDGVQEPGGATSTGDASAAKDGAGNTAGTNDAASTVDQQKAAPTRWTIALQANGGTLPPGTDAKATKVESLEDADPVAVPSAFERAGHTLAGWSTVADPAAWHRQREKELAENPDAPEPTDTPLFVPAGASLYNLTYHYVTLDDGTVRQVSDVTAAEGTDDEGREVQTCDLRGRVRDGVLTLYAQWKETKQEEKGPAGSAPADKPAEPARESASGNPTPAESEQKPVEDKPAATDPAPADGNAEQMPASPSAGPTAPATAPATSEEPNSEPVPTNAEPVPNPPAGTAALLANPQLVPDSGVGDAQATALLDAAQKNLRTQELLSQTLASSQAKRPNATLGVAPLSLAAQSDAAYPTHDPSRFPVYLDGSEIRDCSIAWVTQDGDDNASALNLAPETDAPLNMQGRVQIDLSGERNYEAGTVQIKIPTQVIQNREGEFIGSMTIGVPEEPDNSQSFAYRLVTEGGKSYYVLTNTRTLDSGYTGYIQFTVRDVTPHMVRSGAVSPTFQASMAFTSARGNSTTVYTNTLTASVTTAEEVTHAYKNGGKVMAAEDVPQDVLEGLPSGANADDYVIVRWNSYANVDGNQSFDFDFTDKLGSIESDGTQLSTTGSLVLGTTAGGGTQNADGTYTKQVLQNSYLEAGEARYENVWTAYPKSIFDNYNTQTGRQNNFTITNDVDWTLTPVDSHAATTKSASARIHYHVPVPVDFSAEPGVYDLDKETLEPYRYATSTNVALNTLHKGQDVAIGYTVEGMGETMTYTAETPMDQAALDALAAQVKTREVTPNDVFHKRYVTLELTDDAAYLNGDYATELNSGDYYVSRVQLKAPVVYTYMHKDDDETKEWDYVRDGTQPTPGFSLWGLSETSGATADSWTELVRVTYDSHGTRSIAVTDAGQELGVAADGLNVTLPATAAITRTKMTAATNWDGLRLAYDLYLSLKEESPKVSGIVSQLFAETDNPATTLRNDATLVVYRGDYAAAAGSQNAPAINPATAKITGEEAQNVLAITTSTQPKAANARTHAMDETRYGQHMYHDTSLAYLRGAVPRIGVTSSKTMKFDKDKDLNAAQMQATLHYTAKVHEQSNILTLDEYQAYVREGAIVPETSGTWYDLLPAGVTPDLSTIRLRDQDAIVDSYMIENYQNSGRTMLVVKAELTPKLAYNNKVGEATAGEGYWSQGYYDELQISFDATYNYADYAATILTADHQMADQLINVIAFESGNDVLGNQEGMIGEADDASIKAQNAYNNKETSAAVHGVEDLMSDLHGPKTNQKSLSPKRNTFVYARDESSIVVDRSAESRIVKHVASDAEGAYRTGIGNAAAGTQSSWVNVYENHGYTYRLTVAKTDAVQNIILYDALERYEFNSSSEDKKLDASVDDHRWRGTLASVDVSQLEAMGVQPVVYYSTTITEFDANAAQDTEIGVVSKPINTLFDSTGALNPGWVKASEYTDDLADVTAIAIDARHKADGSSFTLDAKDKLTAYVHMVAPIDSADPASRGYNLFDWGNKGTTADTDNNKHAFNGVYVYSEVVNEQGAQASSEFYHPGYTKVGILPYTLTVNKVWDDHDNNDGKRPDSVTVQLLANGAQATTVAGDPIEPQVLKGTSGWSHTFEHIPYVDANNKPIHYSLSETPITELQDGQNVKLYTPSVLRVDETHLQLTNKRTPETVDVSGTKTWEDDGDAAGMRPSTIVVRLLADGVEKTRQEVAVATDGTWSYEFADMPAYKDGKKIVYQVVEDRVPFYAVSYEESERGSGSQVVDGVVQGSADITNTYSTTGLLAVQKSVTGAKSAAAKNATFRFKVELFAAQTAQEVAEGADKVPLSDIYAYYVEDVATGQKVAGTGYTDSAGEHKGGTVGTGGYVEVGAGQRAVIVGIPAQSTYKVTEEAKSGFTQSASANTEGVVYASLTSADAATASFSNTYKTQGSFQIQAAKALAGQKLGLYAFRFQAYQVFNEGVAGNTDPSKNEYEQVVRSVSNGAGSDMDANGVSTGEVTFGRINVSDADLGPDGTLTLLYRIREVNAGKPGYTYDGSVKQVRVTLADDGAGSLTVTQTAEAVTEGTSVIRSEAGGNVTYSSEPRAASAASSTFANSYDASGELSLTAWKSLRGRALANGEFTFRLTALTAGAPMASGVDAGTGAATYDATYDSATRSFTATNDASGVVAFPTIRLTGANGGKTYIYKVSEDAGSAAGVNYSDEVYYYRVDVQDNGDGTMSSTQSFVKPKESASAEAVAAGDPEAFESTDALPQITNTLQPGTLALTKRLATGSAYNNEEFEFKVVLKGDEITERSSFGYTVGNVAAGSIAPVTNHVVATIADALVGAWDALLGLVTPRKAYAAGVEKSEFWDDCTVELGSDGVLTIKPTNGTSGTFATRSKDAYTPWHNWTANEIASITKVQFAPGVKVTSLKYFLDSEKLGDNDAKFSNLTTVDFTNADVSNLTTMHSMLRGCGSLTSVLGTQSWNLPKCTDMQHAFAYCDELTQLDDLNTWTTSANKLSLHGMFNGCTRLAALDLHDWDVSRVTDMESLFKGCRSLASLNLNGWNTASLTKMNEMFCDCASLTELDLSMLNTSQVTSFFGGVENQDHGVFEGCTSLESVNIGSWNVGSATSTKRMFYGCTALKSLDLSSWDAHSLQDMSQMFTGCSALQTADLGGWNTSSLRLMDETFQDCTSLKTLDMSGWSTPSLTSMYSTFVRCKALESLDLSNFVTPSLTNLTNTFLDCEKLASLDVSNLNVSSVTSMYNTFQGCSSLVDLDLSNWSTPDLTNAVGLFNQCTSLEKLNVSQFDLSKCTASNSVMSMFNGDTALKEVVLSPGFKLFSDVANGNQLPDPPTSAIYTGKWINSTDANAQGKTAAALADSYNGASDAGVYVWEVKDNVYTVRFNANGGVGSMTNQPLATDAAATALKANTYVSPGNDFVGWNTKADGSGMSLANEAEVTAASFTEDGTPVAAKSTVDLYAQWRASGSEASKGTYTMTVKMKAGKTATIQGIPAGTTYQVFENTPAGWTLVEQSGTAGTIAPLATSEASFTNQYAPATASAQLFATKTLDGVAPADGAFSFVLTGLDAAPMPEGATGNTLEVANAAAGLVSFGKITYDEEGTYSYRIAEKVGADDTVAYDQAEWTATVTVTNTGTAAEPVLATSVSYSNGVDEATSTPPTFANATKPGQLTVEKVGQNLTDANKDKEFNFTVQLQNSGRPVNDVSYYVTDASGAMVGTQSLTGQSEGGRNLFTTALDAIGGLFTPTKAYAAVTDSGTFGVDGSCTWEWDGETVTVRATVDGTPGDMGEISSGNIPWEAHKNEMKHFIISGPYGSVAMSQGGAKFGSVFRQNTMLEDVDLSNLDLSRYWRTGNYAAWNSMFENCVNLRSVILPHISGTQGGINTNNMFKGCTKLESVQFTQVDNDDVAFELGKADYMFEGCRALTTIDLSSVSIVSYGDEGVTLEGMFKSCTSLTSANLGMHHAENISKTTFMFQYCSNITDVDLSTLQYSSGPVRLKAIDRMFQQCSKLRTINFKGFNASAVTSIAYMFDGCSALTAIDLTDLNMANLKEINGAFRDCPQLRSLDISTLGTEQVTTAVQMLRNDSVLAKIVIGSGFRDISNKTTSTATILDTLPEVPRTGGYTGNWVMVEDTTKEKSYEQLMASDGRTDAGTWVWQVDPDYYYTVNFKTNGAYYDTNNNAIPGSVTKGATESITLPTPRWDTDAKTFAGWYREADFSGTKFDGGAVCNRTALLGENPTSAYVTLYAKWTDNTTTTGTINVYQQNTSLDGYNLVSSNEYTFTKAAGETETVTPEAIEGFVTPDAKSVTVAQGKAIDFYYDRETYTIKFEKIAAEATGVMNDLAMAGGVAKRLPANAFVREGYSFLGWNTKADGSGTSYTDQQQVKNLAASGETVTLYAQWVVAPEGPVTSTGTYSFKLKPGQTVHFANVPAGTTYSVVESDLPNGWTQTATSNASGTVAANATSAATITNTYDATGVVSLQAVKTMASGSLAEGQFSFQLLDADNGDAVLQTKSNLAPTDGVATAQVLFDQIDYKLADLMTGENGTYAGPKTFTYKVREVNDAQAGVKYDSGGDREVRVTVADAGTGKLTVTPSNLTTTGTGASAQTSINTVFTNDYQPGSLKVSKTAIGTNEASANKKFSFKVALKDAQGEPVSGDYSLVRIAANGTAGATKSVTFENGEATVREVGADESFRIEGIAAGATYEVTEVDVPGGFTQTAASGTTGTIVAGDEAGNKSQASFTNAYSAEGGVALAANKTLADGNIADYTFSFQLYDGVNKLLQTKTNDATGKVAFDWLGFSAADAGTQSNPKTYSYRVAEVNDAQEHVVYDTGSRWVTVSVWDDGAGTLHVTPAWDDGGTAAKFTNRLLQPVALPTTGGSGLAVPVAVVVILVTASGAYAMRRRRMRER